ncbi:hypothetical protein K402DRAFT_394037 [Aulographum hederae CBS 113979]|uniref:Uncharacterized protein n=1 Tax=Aulographum hederae CBS 113979 TaxID=1176131 RepID=A0A6G1GZ26_9PEZI|nr:hypothetical protein K402DRAFT_394037 [Aulographum hederae CBS 113979]
MANDIEGLLYAVEEGDLDEVKHILSSTALRVDSTNQYGETPLHVAVRNNRTPIAEWLIAQCSATDRPTYVTARGSWDQTPLHLAHNAKIVEILVTEALDRKDAFLSARDDINGTPLHCAVHEGRIRVVKKLISLSADKNAFIETKVTHGATLLHFAVSFKKDEQIVAELIKHSTRKGIYVNMQNEHGETALYIAVERKCPSSMISLLLEQGADPGIKEREGISAWDFACSKKRWPAITTFLRRDLGEDKRDYVELSSGDDPDNFYDAEDGLPAFIRSTKMSLVITHLVNSRTRKPAVLECILRQIGLSFFESYEPLPYMRCRESSCIFQPLDSPIPDGESKDFLSLVIPFIHVDPWITSKERQTRCNEKTQTLTHCIGSGRTLLEAHMPLTLDEYCSPALTRDVLDRRNTDQVLGRLTRWKEEKQEKELFKDEKEVGTTLRDELCLLWRARKKTNATGDPNPPKIVVTVHQAWIWKIDDEIIAALQEQIRQKIDNYNSGSDAFSMLGELVGEKWTIIALLFSRIVELFDDPAGGGPAEPLLKRYGNAISILSEDVNEYVRNTSIEKLHVEQEKGFFHQINDIREELSMIRSVLAEQEEVWKEFMSLQWPNLGPGKHQEMKNANIRDLVLAKAEQDAWRQIWQPQAKYQKYRRQIARLEEDAERVERNITIKLDLMQKHASMKESHSASMMSAAVFGFTIITIIFTPLSFMVSLFALPMKEFNQGKEPKNKDGLYKTNYVGTWIATAELASIVVTVIAMWAALRYGMGVSLWQKFRTMIREKAKIARELERASQPNPSKEVDSATGDRTEKIKAKANDAIEAKAPASDGLGNAKKAAPAQSPAQKTSSGVNAAPSTVGRNPLKRFRRHVKDKTGADDVV